MYAEKPSRFVVEYEDADIHEALMVAAKADGSYTEDCDDWFDPVDVAQSESGGDTLANARSVAKALVKHGRTLYDEARIVERLGICETGGFWDYSDTREVETVS